MIEIKLIVNSNKSLVFNAGSSACAFPDYLFAENKKALQGSEELVLFNK